HDLEMRVVEVDERGDEAAGAAPLPSAPDLVMAIGSRAARAARRIAPEAPLVYGMVLDPLPLGPTSKATGGTIEGPVEVQLDLIRQLVPQARRVGILYDPLVSGEAVRKASAAARPLGLVIVPQPVRSESEVLEAARLLAPAADVFLAFADPSVLTAT